MKIVAAGNYLIVKAVESERKSEGGIIIAGSNDEQPYWADVQSAGCDFNDDAFPFHRDEPIRVLVRYRAGFPFTYGGEALLVVRAEDVLAFEQEDGQ